jgi:transposase
VGYDAGKTVKGRKIHAPVDVEGLPLRVIVHSAGTQDRDGAALVLDTIRKRFAWLELVWTDAGYNARQVKDAVARSPGLRLEIVKRTDDIKGFVVLPRRWVVERTFSWFGDRRIAKDYENLADYPRRLRNPRRNPVRRQAIGKALTLLSQALSRRDERELGPLIVVRSDHERRSVRLTGDHVG